MSEFYIAPWELPRGKEVAPVEVIDKNETAVLVATALNHASGSFYGVPAAQISKIHGIESPIEELHRKLCKAIPFRSKNEAFVCDNEQADVVARSIALLALQSPPSLELSPETSAYAGHVLSARHFLVNRQ